MDYDGGRSTSLHGRQGQDSGHIMNAFIVQSSFLLFIIRSS
jgi:hypothetical protein